MQNVKLWKHVTRAFQSLANLQLVHIHLGNLSHKAEAVKVSLLLVILRHPSDFDWKETCFLMITVSWGFRPGVQLSIGTCEPAVASTFHRSIKVL